MAEGAPADQFAPILERNIAALLERRQAEARASTREERIAGAISRFTGSMRFVYIHLVLFASWVVINLGWTPLPEFDPTFVVLAMFASVEAIFLSTFVLITQNRMAAASERRAELDLHISLIAEHEVTSVLRLLTQIAERLEIPDAQQPHAEGLTRDVQPEQVLDRIDASGSPGQPG